MFKIVQLNVGEGRDVLHVYVPPTSSEPIYTSPVGNRKAIYKLMKVLQATLLVALEAHGRDEVQNLETRIQAWVDNCAKKEKEIASLTYKLEQRIKLHQESLTAQEHLQKALHEAQNSKRIEIGELCEGIVFRFPNVAESVRYKIVDNAWTNDNVKYESLKSASQYCCKRDCEVIVVAADAEHFNYVWGDLKAAEEKVKELKQERSSTQDDFEAAQLSIHELRKELNLEKENHETNLKSMREKIDELIDAKAELEKQNQGLLRLVKDRLNSLDAAKIEDLGRLRKLGLL